MFYELGEKGGTHHESSQLGPGLTAHLFKDEYCGLAAYLHEKKLDR